MDSILVTGAAGFIGMHVCLQLLERGEIVIGLDNLNDYYDVGLKKDRLKRLENYANFRFVEADIALNDVLLNLPSVLNIKRVVHLAAQVGVRYSITNPAAYISSNLVGFANILELCRKIEANHLVYASSSSVYGSNRKMPFSEVDSVDHPVSLYAATKRSNELMAHSYSHLYRIPMTGLRFFTVYGPWGRPDMSPILFARAIFEGRPIDVFNHGNMRRDFTYVDDIADSVIKALDKPAVASSLYDPLVPSPSISDAPWNIFNIGNEIYDMLENKNTTINLPSFEKCDC
jgi:UDP-glucuronate 4-epimerase